MDQDRFDKYEQFVNRGQLRVLVLAYYVAYCLKIDNRKDRRKFYNDVDRLLSD